MGARAQLSIKRHGEREPPVRMLESNVASSLASDFPSIAFESFDPDAAPI
jgi:hypothetical protein